MELTQLKVRVKCDNGACANLADYAVKRSGTPVVRELHLCGECLAAIAGLYDGIKVKKTGVKSRKGGKNVGTNMGDRD